MSETTAVAPTATVTAASVWLVESPPGVERPVWAVACLSALGAMDSARKRVMRPAQRPPANPTEVQRLSRWAVARFWALMADFAGLAAAAEDGFMIAGRQPFFGVDRATRRLVVRRRGPAPPAI